MSYEIEQLSDLFAKLGAKDPGSWAWCQVTEDTPQLARYLFLRQAWRSVVSKTSAAWIDATILASRENATAPYAGVGRALEALQARGATAEEITDLVRGKQAELLFGLCNLLDDPGELEDEVADVAWGLFSLDENDRPVKPMSGLQDAVLETDPEG